jgi:hypothetical protein
MEVVRERDRGRNNPSAGDERVPPHINDRLRHRAAGTHPTVRAYARTYSMAHPENRSVNLFKATKTSGDGQIPLGVHGLVPRDDRAADRLEEIANTYRKYRSWRFRISNLDTTVPFH